MVDRERAQPPPDFQFEQLEKINKTLLDVKTKLEDLRTLLLSVTGIDFSESEALLTWEKIFDHRKQLSLELNREVHLSTAISDYFTHIHKILKSPIVMEYSHLIKLQLYGNVDFLTGIYNRYFFHELLAKEISRSMRRKSNFCLALFDINGFKLINDTFGHPTGDKVLGNIALIIKTMMRIQDIPCRYGGDEFICMFPDTHFFYALGIIERIMKKISEVSLNMGLESTLSASYGLSTYPSDGQTVDELIKACDTRLYDLKAENKNRFINERRNFQRIKASGSGLLHKDQASCDIEIQDISSNGLSFKSNCPVERGSTYQVDLSLDPPLSSAKALVEIIYVEDLSGSFKTGAKIKEIAFS